MGNEYDGRAAAAAPDEVADTPAPSLTGRPVALVGPYIDPSPEYAGRILVMVEGAYGEISGRNDIASEAASLAEDGDAEQWASLIQKYGRGAVEDVLQETSREAGCFLDVGSILDAVMGICDDDAEEMLEELRDPDLWVYAYEMFDDGDLITEGLPEEVLELASGGSDSPMTGYEPCSWDEKDADKIKSILEKNGWEVRLTEFTPPWA